MAVSALCFAALCLVMGQQVMAHGQKATSWTATALGKNQVPTPVISKTKSELKFTELNGVLTGTVEVKDIKDFTMAHLHVGNASTNGPIAFWVWSTDLLKPTNQPQTGHFSFPWAANSSNLVTSPLVPDYATFLQFLKAGNIYYNVHTLANPGGEARAQVAPKKSGGHS